MTKNEYLIELATRLQALTDDPNSIYPELTSMISFYQEMLDDKIEDGLTEEEAVAAMESPDEIITRLKNE
ncbi:MAG: HAAS signaling domain-containing protein, partial [Candidatus Fimadaptatus sp.]